MLGIDGIAHAQTEVPTDWSLIPAGLGPGDQFRLLFVSSTTRDATSSDIADYDAHVQSAAAAGHTAIQSYSAQFKALGSTDTVDARDNTGTTHTAASPGVPIYWLNGDNVADDYADFYVATGGWNSQNPTDESGMAITGRVLVWTGTDFDGSADSAPLGGSSGVSNQGNPKTVDPIDEAGGFQSGTFPLYGLSPVFAVGEDVLGGNLDLSAYGYHSLGEYDQAQAFTTGADVGGYTLSSVEIVLFSASDTAFPGTVSIWTEKTGRPGTSLGTLTNPDALDPLGECKRLPCPEAAYAFTSSGAIDLAPSRTYFVVVDADATGETRVNLVGTGSSREEPGGARYWRIADGSLQRDRDSSGGWTNFIDSKRIRINGAAKPPPAGTGEIWSAILTTGVASNVVGCDNQLASFPTIAACSDASALTSDQFIHAGKTYSFTKMYYETIGDKFAIGTRPGLTGSAKYLTLVVDGTPLAFGDADSKEDNAAYSLRTWNNPGFSWSAGQSVSLGLVPLPELTIEAFNDNVPHGDGDASAAGVAEFQVTRSYVRSGETRDARLAFTTVLKETGGQGSPVVFNPGQPVKYLSHFALDEDDQGDPICTITFVLQPGDGYT